MPPIVGTLGLGSAVDEIATDHIQGALQTTGNTYDFGISGQGYFIIDTPQGQRYTRDGSFYRSSTGQLQNVRGQAVLSPQGQPITIPADARNVTVSSDGRIYANGRQIAQLGFVQFDEEKAVIKEGDNLYKPQPGAQPQQATGVIEQGMLEMSNTSVVTEMVELINNYRVYEAGVKGRADAGCPARQGSQRCRTYELKILKKIVKDFDIKVSKLSSKILGGGHRL